MKKFFDCLCILIVSCILVSCSNTDTESVSENEQLEEAMPVSVLKVHPVNMPISAETVAQTEGAREIEIRPRVGGILIKRLYTEGAPVAAGQPLFLIDPEPFQNALTEMRAEFLEQSIQVLRLKREEDRQQKLFEKNFVSLRAYEGVVAEHAIADAALRAAKARVQQAELNLTYTTVTAPINGVTGRSEVSEGALVAANNSLLTTMTQLSPIWVRFSFSDNELVRFGGRLNEQNVQEVIVILPDGSEYQQKGRINFADSRIDPLLGTQQLRATFENADQRILPGQFVRVRVMAGETSQVYVVPQVAVMTSDLGRYVYVINDHNEVEERSVIVGDWVGKDWVVLEGLNAGDSVITDNIIKLSPGKIVEPQLAQSL
jgi:membrane fusion protein, multidrug efflux system